MTDQTSPLTNERWETLTAVRESKQLGRLSHILVSETRVKELAAGLKPGQSLVITYEGSIYTGRVNTEKLTKRQEEFRTERAETGLAHSDPKTTTLRMRWIAATKIPNFGNSWNSVTTLYKSDDMPPFLELFLEKLDEFLGDSPEENAQFLEYEITTGEHGIECYELTIPDFPWSCAVNRYGRLKYCKMLKDGRTVVFD